MGNCNDGPDGSKWVHALLENVGPDATVVFSLHPAGEARFTVDENEAHALRATRDPSFQVLVSVAGVPLRYRRPD